MPVKFIAAVFLAVIYVSGAAAQSRGYTMQQTLPIYAKRAPDNAIYTRSQPATSANPLASNDSNGIYAPFPPATYANPPANGGYNGIFIPPAHNN